MAELCDPPLGARALLSQDGFQHKSVWEDRSQTYYDLASPDFDPQRESLLCSV